MFSCWHWASLTPRQVRFRVVRCLCPSHDPQAGWGRVYWFWWVYKPKELQKSQQKPHKAKLKDFCFIGFSSLCFKLIGSKEHLAEKKCYEMLFKRDSQGVSWCLLVRVGIRICWKNICWMTIPASYMLTSKKSLVFAHDFFNKTCCRPCERAVFRDCMLFSTAFFGARRPTHKVTAFWSISCFLKPKRRFFGPY